MLKGLVGTVRLFSIPFIVARLMLGLYVLLTSLYCLLSHIPFTYHWVIKTTLVSWLPTFVASHPYLYWVAIVIALSTVCSVRIRRAKVLTAGFIVFHMILGISLLFKPLLPALGNDELSFVWSLAVLFPLLWISAIDYTGFIKDAQWSKSRSNENLVAFMAMVGFVLSLNAVILFLRYASLKQPSLEPAELTIAFIISTSFHLLVFFALFAMLKAVDVLSLKLCLTTKTTFVLNSFLFTLMGALVLRRTILPSLSFNSYLADAYSLLIAASLGIFTSTSIARFHTHFGEPFKQNHEISPSNKRFGRGAVLTITMSLIATATLACFSSILFLTEDWNFSMQKISVIGVWALTFIIFRNTWERPVSSQTPLIMPALAGGVICGAVWVALSPQSFASVFLNKDQSNIDEVLNRYSGYDVSFKVAREILSSPMHNEFLYSFVQKATGSISREVGLAEANSLGNAVPPFYSFLQRNTNLSASETVNPTDINFVEPLLPTKAAKPNIFIFVVDSLRQDYLSPYNKLVDFTPSVTQFARESVVLKNAFTRYGGTVLAEPSIWVGGMVLHKQYTEPFHPMNTLQKLIDVEKYQKFITVDPVLRIILKPSPGTVELDQGKDWFAYRFSESVNDLKKRLETSADQSRPVFAYVQPQDLHIRVLESIKKRGDTTDDYPGFDKHYAAAVRRVDEAFGDFVRYLKEKNKFEDSIIILTSDHGDSLGEEGRWGHSTWIFPEIIRIPLIVHIPERFKHRSYYREEGITFSTDITPTLYYLLGHKPTVKNPLFGRPIFTTTAKEQEDYLQDSYLIVSSYGPTYGILSKNGESLYIADATSHTNSLYDLTSHYPHGKFKVPDLPTQAKNEKLIRAHVTAIKEFYNTR